MVQDLGWEVKFITLLKHFPIEVVSMDRSVVLLLKFTKKYFNGFDYNEEIREETIISL